MKSNVRAYQGMSLPERSKKLIFELKNVIDWNGLKENEADYLICENVIEEQIDHMIQT